MDLSVKVGKVKFENPVTVASGTFGYIEKYHSDKDIRKLGAIVPKTVTLKAQQGNPPLRIVETSAGMLNAIGIENCGIDSYINEKLPVFNKMGVPVILSVSGKNEKEFIELAKRANTSKIAALELNLSCPNLKKKNLVAQDEKATFSIIKKVKKISSAPVIAKLTPNVTDISLIAKAAEEAGADAVSLINTLTGMLIDIRTCKPVLGNVTGGLSGPAIMPIALHMVHKTSLKVKIPIIGMGGIMSADDALQFLMAGASMIAVGTANFIDPQTPLDVLRGIKSYMKKNKISKLRNLIGSMRSS